MSEDQSAWHDPAASFAELQSAAFFLSVEGPITEFFNALGRLAQDPDSVFYRGDRIRAKDMPYAKHDSSGKGYIDIEELRSAPKQDVLREFISWRFTFSVRRACKLGDIRVMRLLLMPMNPLLLCTALARSIVTGEFPQMLFDYVPGLPTRPPVAYFPALLSCPKYDADELLLEQLRCPFTGCRELVSADGGQWR